MKFNQRLDVKAIGPGGPAWDRATGPQRRAFFLEAGRLAVEAKREELTRAIGADGKTMAPRKHPRPDGANGPVLTPHDAASRTARLMAAHADPAGMTLFWRAGLSARQRLPWGTILGFHAGGFVRGAPVRDVRLSRRAIGRLKKQLGAWWHARHRADAARVRGDDPTPAPKMKPAAIRKAQAALTRKYPSLGAYFRDPRDGFK